MEQAFNTRTDTVERLEQKGTLGEAPCQNCGKMVTIMLPFIGCVFCGDCMRNDTGQYDGTEDFYDPNR